VAPALPSSRAFWLGAAAVAAAAAALAGAAGAASVQTGSVSLIDKTWICRGPVDLTSVSVTFDQNVADTSATPGGHDAVHLGAGCTGHIGKLTVVQYHGDGVKVGGGSHDIVVDQGSIRCYAHDAGKHQDGIQAMGGTNVQFNQMDIQCNSSNNAAFFVNRGTSSPELPTNVVCEGCFLQGGGITVRIGHSSASGVRDSAVVPGHIAAVRVDQAGAIDPIYVDNRVGVPGAGLVPQAPLALRRAGTYPLPLHVLRRGTVALVGTLIAVNRAATLTVTVSSVTGKPIWILRSSRVGATATGIAHLRVIAPAPSPAPLPLLLRLPAASLHRGALYRVTINAADGAGGHSTLRVPFRG
jgi:hypothetical protein